LFVFFDSTPIDDVALARDRLRQLAERVSAVDAGATASTVERAIVPSVRGLSDARNGEAVTSAAGERSGTARRG
jgi:hypothetical protein